MTKVLQGVNGIELHDFTVYESNGLYFCIFTILKIVNKKHRGDVYADPFDGVSYVTGFDGYPPPIKITGDFRYYSDDYGHIVGGSYQPDYSDELILGVVAYTGMDYLIFHGTNVNPGTDKITAFNMDSIQFGE